ERWSTRACTLIPAAVTGSCHCACVTSRSSASSLSTSAAYGVAAGGSASGSGYPAGRRASAAASTAARSSGGGTAGVSGSTSCPPPQALGLQPPGQPSETQPQPGLRGALGDAERGGHLPVA